MRCKFKALLAIVSVTVIATACTSVDALDPRPDIVVIMADDLGYSDLGAFGGEIRSPNIDALAHNGIRYTNFYAESMCRPSRIAMLTGMYTKAAMRDYALHPAAETIAETLQAEGYKTFLSGKWHVAREHETPRDRGFDHFYGIPHGATNYYTPEDLWRDGEPASADLENPDFHLTDAITDNAVQYITQTKQNDRLFLFVAYTAPHWPLHARPGDVASYRGVFERGWDELRNKRLDRMRQQKITSPETNLPPRPDEVDAWAATSNARWQQSRMEVYAAQVTQLDRGVGHIVDALKAEGRFENTIVLVLSDNGGNDINFDAERYDATELPVESRGVVMQPGNIAGLEPGPGHTYQSYGEGWATLSNTPFRFYKKFAHEGGVRVPFIVHWPVGISQARLETEPAHIIDIYPTLSAAAGARNLRSPNVMPNDGHSLLSAMLGDEAPLKHDDMFFHHSRGRALRAGKWKVVSVDNEPWELYDLASDPVEMTDLSGTFPDMRAALIERWNEKAKALKHRNDAYAE